MDKVLFSHNSDEWETPQSFFDQLDSEFHFTLDPCSSLANHKCSKFFTSSDDGLLQSWSNEVVFCNPPYSDISSWVLKCWSEWYLHCASIVLLVPVRTDTLWFHTWIYPHFKSNELQIRFIKSRLKFGGKDRAPFPSMVIIFPRREVIL